jgi:hypothetical protein
LGALDYYWKCGYYVGLLTIETRHLYCVHDRNDANYTTEICACY